MSLEMSLTFLPEAFGGAEIVGAQLSSTNTAFRGFVAQYSMPRQPFLVD